VVSSSLEGDKGRKEGRKEGRKGKEMVKVIQMCTALSQNVVCVCNMSFFPVESAFNGKGMRQSEGHYAVSSCSITSRFPSVI
jgi:hypothetical protein